MSRLVLDLLHLWLIVEDDVDEAEDHSLTELAGDMLEETTYVERAGFPVVLFLNAAFNGVLCVELEDGLRVPSTTFLLAVASRDLTVLSDETLPELSLKEDLADSVLVDFDEPREEDFKDAAGFDKTRRAPLVRGTLDA